MTLVHNSESKLWVIIVISLGIFPWCVAGKIGYDINGKMGSSCPIVVIIENYCLVNNRPIPEECIFIQVRYDTAISPVQVIPTLRT